MNYSIKKVGTVEACNALLVSARKKQVTLERRRRNMSESIARFNERLARITNELASVQVLLEIFTTACDTLAEGSRYKINMNIRIKRLEVREAKANKMLITCNAHLLLQKQAAYNLLDSKLSAINRYIAAVLHKKVVLGNNAALRYAKQQRREKFEVQSLKFKVESIHRQSTVNSPLSCSVLALRSLRTTRARSCGLLHTAVVCGPSTVDFVPKNSLLLRVLVPSWRNALPAYGYKAHPTLLQAVETGR